MMEHIICKNMWTKFAQQLIEIVDRSVKFNDNIEALKYIKCQMTHVVYPNLKSCISEAYEYSLERDKKNMEKHEQVTEILDTLTKMTHALNFSATPLIMSSYGAKLNLINDSDLDIGILVEDLDDTKINELSNILEENGYKFVKIVGINNTNNYYYSFQKNICDIDVEVKIRDKCKSKCVIDLHYFLDNNLSYEERCLFTYAKFELKKLENQSGYKCMKKLIYEYGFSCTDINNGFLFIM